MENHKQMLDKEYETLLTSFRKELEKLHVKHQQELERKVFFRLNNILNLKYNEPATDSGSLKNK